VCPLITLHSGPPPTGAAPPTLETRLPTQCTARSLFALRVDLLGRAAGGLPGVATLTRAPQHQRAIEQRSERGMMYLSGPLFSFSRKPSVAGSRLTVSREVAPCPEPQPRFPSREPALPYRTDSSDPTAATHVLGSRSLPVQAATPFLNAAQHRCLPNLASTAPRSSRIKRNLKPLVLIADVVPSGKPRSPDPEGDEV